MSLFRSQVHQDIWIEHHCERCARHPDCPIVLKALKSGRKPVEWERNTRKNSLMQDSIKCNMEVRQMPIVRPKAFEDMTIAMFDVEHTTTMDGDHA